MAADNRRTSTRHTVSIAATLVVDGKKETCTMVNLSLGGTQVSGTKHPMGQQVQLNFKVPTMEDPIDVGAIVRWGDNNGIGLQFDGLRARDVWALNAYLKQLHS